MSLILYFNISSKLTSLTLLLLLYWEYNSIHNLNILKIFTIDFLFLIYIYIKKTSVIGRIPLFVWIMVCTTKTYQNHMFFLAWSVLAVDHVLFAAFLLSVAVLWYQCYREVVFLSSSISTNFLRNYNPIKAPKCRITPLQNLF